MDEIFVASIGRILGHEGGYVNNPADPGGETNWGIAKRSYPNVDIRSLTRDGAIDIYYRDFWPLCNMFDGPLAFQMLDAAINHGMGNASRFLQRAVGVADDGHIGPVTVTTVRAMDINDVIMLFLAERAEFYTKLTTFDKFGRGWIRRIAGNLRYAARDTQT